MNVDDVSFCNHSRDDNDSNMIPSAQVVPSQEIVQISDEESSKAAHYLLDLGDSIIAESSASGTPVRSLFDIAQNA